MVTKGTIFSRSKYPNWGFRNKVLLQKSHRTNKRNKTSVYDPKIQSMGSKIGSKIGGSKAVIVNRKNKTSFWDKKLQHKIQETQRKNKIGIYEVNRKRRQEFVKKSIETNKKNKTGVYDPKIQSMGSKIGAKLGGLASEKARRENSPYIYKGIHFSSNQEMEFCLNFWHQFGRLIKEVNYQVRVGSKKFDLLIGKCFIEYHPWDRKFTQKQYYRARRKILDKNGYKNYKLVVIK